VISATHPMSLTQAGTSKASLRSNVLPVGTGGFKNYLKFAFDDLIPILLLSTDNALEVSGKPYLGFCYSGLP
jgi:hypothetical protein